MAATTRHFAFLDGIRGWAAFAVLVFHLRLDRPETSLIRSRSPQWMLDAADQGQHGVAVFFVLSGLVIAYSLRSHLEAPGGFDFTNFVIRRIVRLTPPYYAAIVVALAFAFGAAYEGGHEYLPGGFPFGVERFLAHLIYAQELLGFVNFNDVFWTLSVELQFYIAFAVLVLAHGFFAGRPRTSGVVSAVGATTLQVLLAISAGISLLCPYGLVGADRRAIWFMPVWYSFMLGVLVFARWRRLVPAWPLALYMALLVMAPVVSGRSGVFAWVSVGTAGVLWLAVEGDRLGRWLADGASQFLGRVSYSLYLIHTPILGAMLVVMAKVLGEPTVAKELIGIVVTVGVVLVASDLFYRAVERPAITMSRRLKPSGRPAADGRGGRRSRRAGITP